MTTFHAALRARWTASNSLVCVGLDPDPAQFPVSLRAHPDGVFLFLCAIVDAVADLVCAFKPQIAHFAAIRAEPVLERVIAHIHRVHPGIPVILDAKRGDIGSTAAHYASEAFERYGADAVTVNPYLGRDAVQPFLDRADKGVIVLCRTSNPGAADLQDLVVVGGRPLYQHVADKVAREWNTHGNCALVVGATWPAQLREVRAIVGEMPILVPGVGVQGGDLARLVSYGATADRTGLVVSSSRAMLYASAGDEYARAARAATLALRDAINQSR